MSAKQRHILFVYEGERRERQIIERIKNDFFDNSVAHVVSLSAKGNIYMLYNELKKSDFLDLLDILKEHTDEVGKEELKDVERDDIARTYLFFDCDPQAVHGNIKEMNDTLTAMLDFFSDVSVNGQLYLSYPMCEAIRDFDDETCGTNKETDCIISLENVSEYKDMSAGNPAHNNIQKKILWDRLIRNFLMRVGCLFDVGFIPSYNAYRKDLRISPISIYEKQKKKYIKRV